MHGSPPDEPRPAPPAARDDAPLLLVSHASTVTGAPPRVDDLFETREVGELPAPETLDPTRPTVLVLDRALLRAAGAEPARIEALARRVAIVGEGRTDEDAPGADFPADALSGFMPANVSPGGRRATLRGALRHARALVDIAVAGDAAGAHAALRDLTQAGLALFAERDPLALLGTILAHARAITGSDAGSIYLLERGGSGAPDRLRFGLAQNDSVPAVPLGSFVLPVDNTSLAGHVAATGAPLVIADAAVLPDGVAYQVNRSFDERLGYHTRSALLIPMKSRRDEVVGVLQLINRKRDPAARLTTAEAAAREVVEYDARAVALVTALAAQAAVSIENSLLYASIERLFDGFVAAATTAVETRDPGTYGHSRRVAALAVRLADALNAGAGAGTAAGARFTREQLLELRYAGLLHDFGKVGVREEVLLKATKLLPQQLSRVRQRFAARAHRVEVDAERRKTAAYRAAAADGEAALALAETEARRVAAECAREVEALRAVYALVEQANLPTAPPAPSRALAEALAERAAAGAEREGGPLVTPDELRALSIARGNLDAAERAEVEGHVDHTYRFLRQIPWTPPLGAVPAIAYAHHEKPNGRGYPRQLRADAIPLPARIIAVADVFDALTATDRPYKPAVSVARALEIMREEAAEGGLDAELVETFAAQRLYDPPAAEPLADAPAPLGVAGAAGPGAAAALPLAAPAR